MGWPEAILYGVVAILSAPVWVTVLALASLVVMALVVMALVAVVMFCLWVCDVLF